MNKRDFLKVSGLVTVGAITGFRRVEASIPTAELVLTNGKIITVDSRDSVGEAAAIRSGKMIIEKGKLADMVVWNQDFYTIPKNKGCKSTTDDRRWKDRISKRMRVSSTPFS